VILGLETSCDETAAAVVSPDGEILSNVVASQADLHSRFGGVVPEVASRRHLELVRPVIEQALDEAATPLERIELVAVTRGPGLVGALLVGLSAAKALAWARRLPLAPVDHLQGHVASLFLKPQDVEPAAQRPVRASGPVEGARGNREVPPAKSEAASTTRKREDS
jgi:N6-L-threonylcarbamoyladenine synthase